MSNIKLMLFDVFLLQLCLDESTDDSSSSLFVFSAVLMSISYWLTGLNCCEKLVNCCSSVMMSQTPLHCSKCSFMTVPELKWLLAQAFGEVERRAPSGLLNWLILGHWPQLPITLAAGALLPLWLLMSGSWDLVVHLLLPAFNQPSPLPIARACMTADQCWS